MFSKKEFATVRMLLDYLVMCLKYNNGMANFVDLGPVVQSVVSLTSSLWVISLTVLVDLVYNILIFFAEKM